jgi:UDP-N-acetylmuramyl pentapeptide phosphotransferase/UDP-N-acetylglucosamine-1-phosphate transferase
MLALGAISLCATQEISWAPLAIFAAAAAFLLAVTAVIRRRQSRTLRDELRVDREELCELKERLNVLEMCERRRIMESQRRPLHNMMDTTGLLSPMEDSEKAKIPIAPK